MKAFFADCNLKNEVGSLRTTRLKKNFNSWPLPVAPAPLNSMLVSEGEIRWHAYIEYLTIATKKILAMGGMAQEGANGTLLRYQH